MQNLGYHLLMVMDQSPSSIELVHALIRQADNLPAKHITLLRHCPPSYWEHAGNPRALQREQAADADRQQREMDQLEECFGQAIELLSAAGVPEEHIITRICTTDSTFTDAIITELRRRHYSDIIVSSEHTGLINRLQRQGVWRLLPVQQPDVAVWPVTLTVTA
jgi:hypothetical protein